MAALLAHARKLVADPNATAIGWRWAKNLLAANPTPKVSA
jgi:hypothetical protein